MLLPRHRIGRRSQSSQIGAGCGRRWVSDQIAQEKSNPPPWKPQIAKQIEHMYAEEEAGRPFPIIDHCFPTGMPSWMLITHNAFEILVTPGRVTILGEGDGNRLRRIYTDGRPHPADPDPSFHGNSIGHWEGDTLVVDTVAVLPQVYLAVNEAVGVPNNGDMHIVERLHLQGPDTLLDDLQINANKLLSKPWNTTRKYYRQRAKKYDIAEGVCEQGSYTRPSTRRAMRFSLLSNFIMAFPWGRTRNETSFFESVVRRGHVGSLRCRRAARRRASFLRHV
jgi:hypothetical protein